ncbi:NAD-dependent epimerase/dehydratase family protein [Bdellovibrionota bacterium FG-2]
MKTEHLLITGGAGFIGSNLAAELLTHQVKLVVCAGRTSKICPIHWAV